MYSDSFVECIVWRSWAQKYFNYWLEIVFTSRSP